MSDGGLFLWKRQDVDEHRGPASDYSNLQQPLPNPPKGYKWERNPETREWCMISTEHGTESDAAAEEEDSTTGTTAGLVSDTGLLPNDCDYLSHKVLSTDTLQGICLKYDVTPTVLRQMNRFSGSNLALAPQTLTIPLTRKAKTQAKKTVPDSREQKISTFMHTFRSYKGDNLGRKEAIAYLDMNDGELESAIRDAKEDIGWENGTDESETGALLV